MLFPKFITSTFYHQVRAYYPASIDNLSFLNFLMYLALGSWTDKNSHKLRLNQEICAILEGKLDELPSKRYCARDYLNEMKSFLPQLEISGWNWNTTGKDEKSHCRYLIVSGLSKEFIEAAQLEKINLLQTERKNLINYKTSFKFDFRKDVKIELDLLQEQSEVLIKQCSSVVDLQLRFLKYFNELDTHVFNKALTKNLSSTIELANNIQWKTEESKDSNLKMLSDIKLQPKPIYVPSEGTRRLFGLGASITYLKKELRQELTKGWIEFDISNCHLAIAAKEWNVPELTALLASGQTIWTYLDSLDGYDLKATTTGKPFLKTVIYSLIYGDSKQNMIKYLMNHGMSRKQVNLFFEIPLIKTLFDARQREIAWMMHHLMEQKDCFNEPIEVMAPKHQYDRGPARSVLSRKAQAIELKLLEPLIEFSEKRRDICLAVLYQFDGFSAVCHDKSKIHTQCRAMKKVLDEHIKNLGYMTHVEYKINGE